ncbi:MAG: metallophosphoesterase family protein [Candidatus Nitrosocaldus sp.]
MHEVDLRKVLSIKRDEFISLLDNVIIMIKKERANARVGNHSIIGGLARISSFEELILIGDLHGDLNALLSIVEIVRFLDGHSTLILLGDYGDRGMMSVEVYSTLLYLKSIYPDRIIMLRGNHEGPIDLPFYPHDLPMMLEDKFGTDATQIYLRMRELFNIMYTGVLVDGLMLVLHGGIPVNMKSLDDVAYAEEMYPKSSNLEEILWNDPRDIQGYRPSARGYGYYFGKDITEHALGTVNARLLVRAHEPCNGYKIDHDGLVLTLFSCKEPYGNDKASYMSISIDEYEALTDDYSLERLLRNVHIF